MTKCSATILNVIIVTVAANHLCLSSFNILDSCNAITLLSDISRPAFLIDLQAVQKSLRVVSIAAGTTKKSYRTNDDDIPIPPILLPRSMNVLVPQPMNSYDKATYLDNRHTFDSTTDPVNVLDLVGDLNRDDINPSAHGDICLGYIHCQIDMPNTSEPKSNDSTFLAQLNVNLNPIGSNKTNTKSSKILPIDTTRTIAPAHLVLGLNNHHVISYYWARAAGSGAAMEAPGIVVVNGDISTKYNAQLRWASNDGYTSCNSNDGKRSEWVGFLKDKDQVQLRPDDFEDTVLSYVFNDSIYGITRAGRPMGSEPVIACKWDVISSR